MQIGSKSGMTDEDKLQRAVALRAIAEKTQDLLARQKPDSRKHELASDAARRYKDLNSEKTQSF